MSPPLALASVESVAATVSVGSASLAVLAVGFVPFPVSLRLPYRWDEEAGPSGAGCL